MVVSLVAGEFETIRVLPNIPAVLPCLFIVLIYADDHYIHSFFFIHAIKTFYKIDM